MAALGLVCERLGHAIIKERIDRDGKRDLDDGSGFGVEVEEP